MLKRILINGKSIPVPVPLKSLAEAFAWVEGSFVPSGSTVTKVILDGKAVEDVFGKQPLRDDSKLEIRIESPVDLSVQTLDAILNFSDVILRVIKQLAVDLWQTKPNVKIPELTSVQDDCQLITNLMDHALDLISGFEVDRSTFFERSADFKSIQEQLSLAIARSDWKATARILLNRLEPNLKDLVSETETLQVRILASRIQILSSSKILHVSK